MTTFESLAALRAYGPPLTNETCILLGYYAPGDGGGGYFYWDASSTENDNSGTIIKGSSTTGRWKRLYSGEISIAWFGITGNGTDETSLLSDLLKWVPNGSVLDFQHKEIALYNTVTGVTSGDAIPLNKTVRLSGKTNITLKNGRLYAATPGTSGTKYRFPSTFAIDGCSNINLENLSFYAKGQSYGDADASASLGAELRRNFLAQNGGHALVIIRSSQIYVNNCRCYLAGSTGSLYISSSSEVNLSNCHSNPASYGYAAYAADAWCGSAAVAGFPDFKAYFNNCTAYAENLGTGSPTYCAKGGVVIEDKDVSAYVNGGYYANMWANGGALFLGNAFSCGSASIFVHDSAVFDCATILYLFSSTANGATAIVDGITATKIGLSAVLTGIESNGPVNFTFQNCNIDITSDRLQPSGIRQEYRESSVFGILKTSIAVNAEVRNCIVTGNAQHMILNTKGIYGGIRLYNSRITVSDFIATSDGWGASTVDTPDAGLLIAANTIITVSSTTATSSLINWKSKSTDGVFTRVRLNLQEATITANGTALRPLLSLLDPTGGPLIDFLSFPESLKGCYLSASYSAYRVRRLFEVSGVQNLGLAGSNTVWQFKLIGNRPPNFPCLIVADDKSFIQVFQPTAAGYTDGGDGTIRVNLLLMGDVRSRFTIGNSYTIME
ncbi:hypothetical protein [Chitinophaga sp. RAB17]|uniref:hypothetical protein n=1 Tax=Chitinophaga sp. RAB17 TaxID=3233049 RepID=UPI003F90D167